MPKVELKPKIMDYQNGGILVCQLCGQDTVFTSVWEGPNGTTSFCFDCRDCRKWHYMTFEKLADYSVDSMDE